MGEHMAWMNGMCGRISSLPHRMAVMASWMEGTRFMGDSVRENGRVLPHPRPSLERGIPAGRAAQKLSSPICALRPPVHGSGSG